MLRAVLAAACLLGMGASALAAPPTHGGPAPTAKAAPAPAAKPAAAPAAADELKITGPAGEVVKLKAAELAVLPHVTVKADIHGKAYAFEGVELTGLLAKAGAPTGANLRGPALSDVVIATASDGYRLVLSLIETDPRIRANKVIVADKVDGQALGERDGPFRLVVEGDLDAARFVRNLAAVEVRKVD